MGAGKANVLLIDVGLANTGSVAAALERIGVNYTALRFAPDKNSSEDVFTHLILPGVGTFKKGAELLTNMGWFEWIRGPWIDKKGSVLGICLGMQLLSDGGSEGDEGGNRVKGLGLISGTTEAMDRENYNSVPHVGWNEVIQVKTRDCLFRDIDTNEDFYFVHSYHFNPGRAEDIAAITDHGKTFVSCVQRDNIVGVQFHPEKSQKKGMRMLENFLRYY